jgi:CrcB protein
MERFLLICLGGAVGTGARYLLSGWVLTTTGSTFPWGTLAVNVVGSFLIGIIMHLAMVTQAIPPTARIVLTTGIMGGFTTYSTFNYETLQFFQSGAVGRGIANIGLMIFSCLAAGLAGLMLARKLAG